MGTSTHTLQKGRQELLCGEGPGDGRIRKAGAGRRSTLPQHPEWTRAVVQIIEPHTAGLPQDENVVWISLSVTQIMNELAAIGYDISRYFVNQILLLCMQNYILFLCLTQFSLQPRGLVLRALAW